MIPHGSFPSVGRLLRTGRAEGAWNMAVDEILLENPTDAMVFRLYGWTPATLSLGYFQSENERQGHLASLGCPLVRRTSGGGAILHDQELTYSLIISRKQGLHLDTKWVYDLVHDSLREVLRSAGIPVESCVREWHPQNEPAFLCFQRHCVGDLLLGPHKVVGSAQRRSTQAVLQHGSILLCRSPQAPELPGILDLVSTELTPEQLEQNWPDELASRLGVEWHPDEMTDEERVWADERRAGKFAAGSWTSRR